MKISNQQARHIILDLQGLTQSPHVKFGPGGLYDLITQLGFVQVDSIQWVERAHHMILFARNQTYRPIHLKQLIEKERLLFEHWTHDASIIPSQFFPYWRHKFVREKERLNRKFDGWQGEGYRTHCAEVLDKIERDGRVRSRDLEKKGDKPQEMWQWHDGKAALEYLWRTGELCIAGREGFQKVYGPVEQGIPQNCFERRVSHDEFIDWTCRSALDRLGFATPTQIARYWDLISIGEAKEWVDAQGSNSIVPVHVEGVKRGDEKPHIARADIASVIDSLADVPKRLRALSPFDPVIRDRNRMEWLFGFEYRIEIYVPEHKRRWGYYVYPLLEGDKIVGRIDMRAKRKDNQLEVKKVWWENGRPPSSARLSRLNAELQRQARLADVQEITFLNGALD